MENRNQNGDLKLKIEALEKKTKEVSDVIKMRVKEKIIIKLKLKNNKLILLNDDEIEILIQNIIDETIDEIVDEDKKFMNSLVKGLENSIFKQN